MTNDTCVKSSMEPQAYKIVSTRAREISVCSLLSRLIHSRAPCLGGMNGDVSSDLSTLAFNNGEQLEYFHSIIIRLQQGIIFSGETVSPTKLLFQYMRKFSKIYKLKAFVAPKMIDLITFLDNNRKFAVYTGRNIHRIYRYLDMLGAPTKFTPAGQSSCHFGT